MGWHVVAGIFQLVLTAYFVVLRWSELKAFWRTGRRTVNTFLYLVPMAILAVATLTGAVWAIVVSAVFYSAWLLNHLFSWWIPYLTGWPHGVDRGRNRPAPTGRPLLPPRRGRPNPDLGHLILGLLLVAVVVVSWYAAVAAYR